MTMTIDEAIKETEPLLDGDTTPLTYRETEAVKLGREALKRFKYWRPIDPFPGFNLLPGETK